MIKDIAEIKNAIITHDYSNVKHFSIKRIRESGYDIIINEGITVQQEGNGK